MDFLKLFAICLFFGGCSSLAEAPELCDLPCGPCDLGRWSCKSDSCELGHLDGVLNENDTCDDVSFVAEGQGGKGTLDQPFDSIAKAVESRSKLILVQSGTFNEGLVVSNISQMSILGGLDEEWEPTARKTKIISSGPGFQIDTSENIVLRGFSINPELSSLQKGGEIVSSKNIKIEGCQFNFQDFSKNEPSNNGADGVSGGDGESGTIDGEGGDGGENERCDTAGGNGGSGVKIINGATLSAERGENSNSGSAGGSIGAKGMDGTGGRNGADGTHGKWLEMNGRLVIVDPTNGADGANGDGGGGGGGSEMIIDIDSGRGGAGGGAGGCGGSGGDAGRNGGTAVGLSIYNTSITLEGLQFNMVKGGDGKAGGQGGNGGTGGRGGIIRNEAGAGGAGGDGGNGGMGGDGLSGQSIPLVCLGDSTKTKIVKENIETNENENGEGNEDFLPNCN